MAGQGSCLPISPATSLSRPEKIMSQSVKLSALHGRTVSAPSSRDIGIDCFHFVASLYFSPAERSDAPMAHSLKCGCLSRSKANLWPTEPVPPRTPGSCMHY